ncbi:MAG: beta-ketoacyl synthase N-terminal-like domain-containing protein, partial [Actinocrinis sp.]
EAEAMEPQHRLFLECAWEALERLGEPRWRDAAERTLYALNPARGEPPRGVGELSEPRAPRRDTSMALTGR